MGEMVRAKVEDGKGEFGGGRGDSKTRPWIFVSTTKWRCRAVEKGTAWHSTQVAKNIVLAGVGLVGLLDDTPCSSRLSGNFLVSADSDPTTRWAGMGGRGQMQARVCVAGLGGL